jgi:hypothetical protein
MKFTTRRAVCSSSAPCKYEKICVNFHGLVQEQRCVVCFETCAVIWKIYLAELLLPSYSFSGFSGSFTEMRRKDIRALGHIDIGGEIDHKHQAASFIKRAKCEREVGCGEMSVNQSYNRHKLIAVAVATCCRCVRGSPI